jgi:hypothetical protein
LAANAAPLRRIKGLDSPANAAVFKNARRFCIIFSSLIAADFPVPLGLTSLLYFC